MVKMLYLNSPFINNTKLGGLRRPTSKSDPQERALPAPLKGMTCLTGGRVQEVPSRKGGSSPGQAREGHAGKGRGRVAFGERNNKHAIYIIISIFRIYY